APQFMTWMKLPEELMGDALVYMRIAGGFSFLQAALMTSAAIIRSNGFTKDTMYVTIFMNLLNIVGNYLFIFGPFGIPVLGTTGVAISTAVSRGIGLVLMVILLFRRVRYPLPLGHLFRFPKMDVKRILRIGIPSAGENTSYMASQLAITYFVTSMGTESLTTRVYALNILTLIHVFSGSIGQGTQILVGHQIGAGDSNAAYKQCLRGLRYGMALALVFAVLYFFLSDQLFGLFTDNASIIATGATLL